MKESVIDRVKSFSKRTYGKWVYQILFIVMVILIISSSVLMYFLFSIDDNLNEINSNLVSFLKMDIEARLYDIQHYVASFSTSYLTGALSDGFDEESLRNSADSISDVLQGYCHVNSLISHMHVYYPDLDLMTGDIGAFKTKHYYSLLNKNSPAGMDEYLQIITNDHPGFYLAWSNGSPVLCIVRPLRTKTETFGFVVVELNGLQLLSSVNNEAIDTSRFQNEFAVIYDNYIIASSLTNSVGQSIKDISASIPRTKKIVMLDSDTHLLKYAGVFKSITLDRQMYISRLLVCFLIVFIVLFGFFASMIFAKRNWQPVKRIMDKLNIDNENDQSGFEQLNDKIEGILRDYNSSEEKLTEYTSIISSVFLENILKEKKKDEKEIVEFANTLALEFSLPCFAIVTIVGDSLIQIMENLQKNIDYDSDIICCLMEDSLFVYVGLDDTDDQQKVKSIVETYVDANSYFVGIGSIYDSLDCIRFSAKEALSLYKSGLCGVHCYSGEPLSNNYIHDNKSILRIFLKCIEEKRYPQAISMISDVFNEYFGDGDVSSIEYEIKFHGIKDKLQQLSKDIDDSAFDYTSKESLMMSVIQVLGALNAVGDTDLPQKAMSIIRKKYNDPQFGLFSLSQELNVSNSYLSTKFKNEFGIGIARCIGNLRMDEAKRLIMTTDLPIREIATLVGFSSDIAFLRAFKRMESTTPTNMRKNIKEQGDEDENT